LFLCISGNIQLQLNLKAWITSFQSQVIQSWFQFLYQTSIYFSLVYDVVERMLIYQDKICVLFTALPSNKWVTLARSLTDLSFHFLSNVMEIMILSELETWWSIKC
jgi:hypothetical protein